MKRDFIPQLVFFTLLSTLLVACGGGGSSSGSQGSSNIEQEVITESNLDGIWWGSYMADGVEHGVDVWIEPNGTVWMSSENYNAKGSLALEGSELQGSLTIEDNYTEERASSQMVVDDSDDELLIIELTHSDGSKTEISLRKDEEVKLATPSNIAGVWGYYASYDLSVTIDGSGSLNGSDSDGCTYTGKIEPKYNFSPFYNTVITVDNCADWDLDGTMRGTSYILEYEDETTGETIEVIYLLASHAAGFFYLDFFERL